MTPERLASIETELAELSEKGSVVFDEVVPAALKLVRELVAEIKRLNDELEAALSQSVFYTDRFNECHRCATFYEQALIARAHKSLKGMNEFFNRWEYTVLKNKGVVYGITPPKDWEAPKDPTDDGQRPPAPEFTATPVSLGGQRTIVVDPGKEGGDHTACTIHLPPGGRLVAVVVSGVEPPKQEGEPDDG